MNRPYIKGGTLYLPRIDSPTLDDYQKTLESRTTLKTINNMSLLGSGNIVIKSGGGASSPAVESIVGSNGLVKHVEHLNDGESIQMDEYPQSNRRGDVLSFRADIPNDNNFVGLKIAHGTGSYGMWFEIDGTNLYVCTSSARTPHAHGLTISEFIEVHINFKNDANLFVVINTLNSYFEYTESYALKVISGLIEVDSLDSTLTNCTFSATNPNFKKQVWIFGASFESESSNRWIYWARRWGYDNFYLNAFPGRKSDTCYEDFLRALNFGTPRYLFWTMFGNGSTASLKSRISDVRTLAATYGFDVIITLRPSSVSQTDPSKGNDRRDKTRVIEDEIASGCRYVDYSSAVLDPNGDGWRDWRTGYIDNDDGAHPSQLGARAIALQILVDFPEITQY